MRLALIGFGNIARKHLDVFRALNVDIVASCNRSDAKNALAVSEGGISETFTDYHKMIKEVAPDGILVCVSFWEMERVLNDIIPYGIPILAEKPTATSLQAHMLLFEKAKSHRTPVMVGLNRRHYSVLRKAIDECGGKDMITSVSIEWSENPDHLMHKRKLSSDQIRKYIFGNSIHGIDLLHWLAGPLGEASIFVRSLGDPFRWLMNANGLSSNGTIYSFSSSWDNPVPWRVTFTARNRRYVLAPLERCAVQVNGVKEMYEIEPSDEDRVFKAGFYEQARLFVSGEFQNYGLESVNESMRLAQQLTDLFNETQVSAIK